MGYDHRIGYKWGINLDFQEIGYQIRDFLEEHRYAAVNLTAAFLQVLVFVINTAMHGALFEIGKLSAARVIDYHEYYRLLTVVFLHADFAHLAGNLVGQVAIGSFVEKNLGHLRFLLAYLLCTLGADLCSMAHAVRTSWTGGAVGSSGAVFGLMGILVVLIFRGINDYNGYRMPRERALFMLAYSLYIGFQSTSVDNAAHVGGMLTGLLVGLAMTSGRQQRLR